jgi:hypothetical protein
MKPEPGTKWEFTWARSIALRVLLALAALASSALVLGAGHKWH